MKITYKSSKDHTENEAWNGFYPENWQRFKDGIGKALIDFVDIVPPKNADKYHSLRFWENKHDTVVFLLDTTKLTNPLEMVSLVKDTNCDEFHYVEVSPNKYAVRLWWD